MAAVADVQAAPRVAHVVPHAKPVSGIFEVAFTNLIEGFVQQNSERAAPTCFDGGAKISIAAYIKRLVKHVVVQEEDLLVALILLDRILYGPVCVLNYNTFHRLFLVSLTTAIKTRQDCFKSNKYYAAAGGVSLRQFNVMERQFLTYLDFDVTVDLDVMQNYCTDISKQYDFGATLDAYILLEPPAQSAPATPDTTHGSSSLPDLTNTQELRHPNRHHASNDASSWGYSDEGCQTGAWPSTASFDAVSVASQHTGSFAYPPLQYTFWNM
eukprot:TRINITY_DN3638_c1_g5_i1.p1 TRINITY_DN3638_c1_g5~~TRINITY_DN3638_c1_g5_i1.p1  ORF type:complete len:269 (+),score=83.28 TRINITY_DN3638_c1_g5_i1:53-859(+)